MLEDGADRLVVFPSATHSELSPLDNKVNAIAKNWWRTERLGDNFSKQDLHLLWCLDWVEPSAVQSCWDQNFMLQVKKLSLATTKDQLQGKNFRGVTKWPVTFPLSSRGARNRADPWSRQSSRRWSPAWTALIGRNKEPNRQ